MLQRARRSKVLNVKPMRNLRSFDKNVERCLTVKHDAIVQRQEESQTGATNGFQFPSVLFSQANLTQNSILSSTEQDNVSRDSILGKEGIRRKPCDVQALKVLANHESDTTPSMSPPPMVMLRPKQASYMERTETMNRSKNNSSIKGFFSHGRGESTLSKFKEPAPSVQDQLNKVLSQSSQQSPRSL